MRYWDCGHPIRPFSRGGVTGFEPCRVCALVCLQSWECHDWGMDDVADIRARQDAREGEWRGDTFHRWTSEAEPNSYPNQPRTIAAARRAEAHARKKGSAYEEMPSFPDARNGHTVPPALRVTFDPETRACARAYLRRPRTIVVGTPHGHGFPFREWFEGRGHVTEPTYPLVRGVAVPTRDGVGGLNAGPLIVDEFDLDA